jgi:uncharacterized protein (TIGR04222 family)
MSVAAVCLARRRVWCASGPAGPDPRDLPELDDYELACLNGGAAMAATTAALVLLRAGHLAGTEPAERHLSQEMHLRPGTPPPSPHPVEQAVYELVAAHPDTAFTRLQKLAADTPPSPPCRRACAGSGWPSPSAS